MKKKIKNLQSIIDNLIPYLRSITIDGDNNFLPILTLFIENTWNIPFNEDFDINSESINDYVLELQIGILNKEKTLDDLVEFVQNEIVTPNEILQEKQKEIEENIRKIQEESLQKIEQMKQSFLKNNYKNKPVKKIIEPENIVKVNNETPINEQPFIPNNQNSEGKVVVKLKDLREGNLDFSHLVKNNAELFMRDEE